jgi:hypothetical protein
MTDWRHFDGYTMPFGKYLGDAISEIVRRDREYARWVIENVEAENVVEVFREEMEKSGWGYRRLR